MPIIQWPEVKEEAGRPGFCRARGRIVPISADLRNGTQIPEGFTVMNCTNIVFDWSVCNAVRGK